MDRYIKSSTYIKPCFQFRVLLNISRVLKLLLVLYDKETLF